MHVHGPHHGIVHGISHGIDRGNLMGTVTIDSSSNKYVPSSVDEWNTVMTVASVSISAPNHLFLCQEASGDLVDTIGGAITNLSPQNGPLYEQAVSGWTRKAVGFTDGGSNRFILSSGFPDPLTTPYFFLTYMATTDETPAANRFILSLGSAAISGLINRSTGHLRTVAGANQTADSTNTFGNNIVRPLTLFADSTGNVTRGGDDQQLQSPTHADASGVRVAIPNASAGASSPTQVLYMAIWTGVQATNFSTANLKAVLQTLGWSIPWS